METNEEIKRMFDGIRNPMFDLSDVGGEVVYIQYDPKSNNMLAGGCTNIGLIPQYKMEYDKGFTLDMNLQAFYEKIRESLMDENGK